MGAVTYGHIFVIFVDDMPRLYRNTSTITIDADDTSLSLSSFWSDISTLSPLFSQKLEHIETGFKKTKRIRTLIPIRPRHY